MEILNSSLFLLDVDKIYCKLLLDKNSVNTRENCNVHSQMNVLIFWRCCLSLFQRRQELQLSAFEAVNDRTVID